MHRFFMALVVALLALPVLFASGQSRAEEPTGLALGRAQAKAAVAGPPQWITADHSKHEALQQAFTSGPEVTKACLSCHNEAAMQVHKTIHWTWKCPHDDTGQMGKYAYATNNFCVAVQSNEPRCTSCHVGYGWKDASFDHTDPTKVDCLVCHEQTGTYKKFPTKAGNPVSEETPFGDNVFYPPDWNKVAQSVGKPSRLNCGGCHFNGGGGNGVKHGDLDDSLIAPEKKLDVHMSPEGGNFDCSRCHTTEAHRIAGRCYQQPAATSRESLIDNDQISRITCESCHTANPHKPGVKANDHTDKVACQTCHIPAFAREKPTKMWWDWSLAGKKNDKGKPFATDVKVGDYTRHSYDSKKGEFVWERNVTPEYHFFNGTLGYTTLLDTVDDTRPVRLNFPVGDYADANSRIYPFKNHRGKTPYDPQRKRMVVPHLFGKDDAAYWKNYDWNKAVEVGMAAMDLPFSGEVGFVETEYFYPTTHMVAPAENSLACADCHDAQGRMKGLTGFYMPGRDNVATADMLGWFLVFGSVAGVGVHGGMRLFSRNGRPGSGKED